MNNRKYYIMAVVGLIAIVAVSVAIIKQNNSTDDMNEGNIDFSQLYPEKQGQNEDFNLSEITQNNYSVEDDIMQMPSESVTEDVSDSAHEGTSHQEQIVQMPDEAVEDNDEVIQNEDTEKQAEAQVENESIQAEGATQVNTEEEHNTEATVPVGGSSVESTEEVQNIETEVAALTFDAEAGLMWPVTGNVILNYSPDHLIYHATLNQFRTNPAIVISCEEGTEVAAAAAGIVTDISDNNTTGVTITTDIGDGFKLVYGQLKETEFELGDRIEKGECIGIIDKVSHFYCKEGNNLYFKVLNNESTVNPMELLTDNSDVAEAAE